MKNKITYIVRCEFCNEKTEYIARMGNVNNSLSDKDIRKMVSIYSENSKIVQYCDHCKLETLQTRIAWRGTLDT